MKKLLFIFLLAIFGTHLSANQPDYPLIGAEVFIEPGQTKQDIYHWFKVLNESGMTVCRIRMFESYMKDEHGNWDYSLFDTAFEAAEKYNIKIFATFFPKTTKTDIGGWKFPKSDQQMADFADYIKQSTLHFKKYKSLYAWVLINEPGYNHYENEFVDKMRTEWEKTNPTPERSVDGYPVLVDLSEQKFLTSQNTWFLKWIAGEVRKYDQTVQLHVNPHALFSLIKEYDFPQWRPFLNSLGGSAHASWHFGDFSRPEYAMAMSANSEIIQSGAGNLPWLMTEMQGGNITYSGSVALCPTAEEITQWLWMVVGTEGKGGIFWMLNARAGGIESGEWALLDFQQQPTDRLNAATKVANCLKANSKELSCATKVNSGINILYINESLLAEEKLGGYNDKVLPRATGSIMKDMLGYFETFNQLGVSPNIKSIKEFDFSQKSYENQHIILANQIAIPRFYADSLTNFVNKGGKLIVDGLTGFYDENVQCVMLTGFPLKKLFGGEIAEFKYDNKPFAYKINSDILPGYGWKSIIKKDAKSETLFEENKEIRAIRNKQGKGEVVWIPTLIGLNAKLNGGKELAEFLQKECNLVSQPFIFDGFQPLVNMKTLKTAEGYVTIIVNKSAESANFQLYMLDNTFQSTIIFADKTGAIKNNRVNILPEETLVINWSKQKH